MSIKETFEKIERVIDKLYYSSSYVSTQSSDLKYTAKNLVSLKDAINELADIEFIQTEITELKSSALFKNYKDEDAFNSTDNSKILGGVQELRIGLEFLLNYYYSLNQGGDSVIQIKLPETKTFDELSKISNELKKSLELPLLDSNTDGRIEILTAESGSIWLMVSVGTVAAVNLVGAICWASAVIRKKMAEARIFEAHAKTLDLKNEALQNLIDAQEQQLKNIVIAEAEAIATNHYDNQAPETIARLKLSLETIADLIERGAKILPSSKEEDIKKVFPDYSNLALIESTIKQIANQ
ncbi:hypothetical protein [Parapedobacter koreensis]|uniref:Uncharacterized protein n=1 Tax=Parapedobacter koreensis TaxID=332977 RepID=A0A1H7U9Z4_9SPHI|nr:hypothetical protein [Parapedobacter koreensis]SEL93771.1 hypothetical protein SAMN05421740_11452 [Parapedobacter koreensis]